MKTIDEVLQDVAAELERANAKHGDPERPMIYKISPYANPNGLADGIAQAYGIPTAWRAQHRCEKMRAADCLTHFDIALEEVCEALEAAAIGTPDELYLECVQTAAMFIKMARRVKP